MSEEIQNENEETHKFRRSTTLASQQKRNYEYNKMQPIALLMHYIIRWAKKNNLTFVDYGVSHMPQAENPLTPSRSLIKFKEEFGCFSIIRNAYSKKIND